MVKAADIHLLNYFLAWSFSCFSIRWLRRSLDLDQMMDKTYLQGNAQQIIQELPEFTHVVYSSLLCWVVLVFGEDSSCEWRLNHSIFPRSQTSAQHFLNHSLTQPSSFHLFLINTHCQDQDTLPPEEATHKLVKETVKQSINWTVRTGPQWTAPLKKHSWQFKVS